MLQTVVSQVPAVRRSDVARVFAESIDTSLSKGGEMGSCVNPVDPDIGLGVLAIQQALADEVAEYLEFEAKGICKGCGDKISKARLQAIPHAVRCKECQERKEREES